MARKSIKTVPYRRRREGKTNYKDRLNHLLSLKPRLVIRSTTKNIIVQIVEYHPDGDLTKAKVKSGVLHKYGWKFSTGNIPASYLTGLLAGKVALSAGVKEGIADFGLKSKIHGSKIYAALKGVVDSGFKVPHSESCFPTEERIKGNHIQNYASNLKEGSNQFGLYYKNKLDPANIEQMFEETKKKILES